jgi:hypothetical protein
MLKLRNISRCFEMNQKQSLEKTQSNEEIERYLVISRSRILHSMPFLPEGLIHSIDSIFFL